MKHVEGKFSISIKNSRHNVYFCTLMQRSVCVGAHGGKHTVMHINLFF